MSDASAAGGSEGSATEQAQEKVQEVAGQAQQKAGEAAEKAQETVRRQVDQRSTEAGERVGSTAEDLKAVGEELRKQGKEGPAKLAERAAEQTDKLGSYLREKDSDELLAGLEDFGRRRPWAALAGGLVVGIAAARFLKASSRGRYERRSSSGAAGARPEGQSLAPAVPPSEHPRGVVPAGPAGTPVSPGVGP